MAFDRRHLLTTTADKIAVREYVKEAVGEHVLTKSFGAYFAGENIDWSRVPKEFVAKVNHGCGGNIIVSK